MIDFSKDLKKVLALNPDQQAVGAVNGPDVDTEGFREIVFICALGTAVTTGEVTFKLQSAPDDGTGSAGSYGDHTGSVNSGALTTDNSLWVLRVRADNIDDNDRWLRIVSTVANDAVDVAAVAVLGMTKDAAPNVAEDFTL
jgi:hypothetical protein